MALRIVSVFKISIAIALILAIAGAITLFGPQLKERLLAVETQKTAKEEPAPGAELVADEPDTIALPADVVRQLRVQMATAEPARSGAELDLSGTLLFDTNRLSHVHARFAGEVIEIGTISGGYRPVDFGEMVHKDQLLCVIWSRDLGEKKSDLVDALSQLHLDQDTLDRLTESSKDGAVPERTVREARRKVEADEISVARIVRTLQSWRIPKEEIDAVRAEAEQYYKTRKLAREELVHEWARLEIRAPLDGVIVERNAVLGELVDTNIDLFMVADLSRLRVAAHAYEEDLPTLDALTSEQRRWAIRAGADPKAELRSGGFDQIGRVVDPNQHTALVMGWVDNSNGRLRVGQFITAKVELPRPRDEVAIPASALVEQGNQKLVFVQPDAKQFHFTRRQVSLTRRVGATVFVRSQLDAEEQRLGVQPLPVGQRVVSSGAVPLLAALGNLQSATAGGNK
jgi:cobalt-zinc-cadmium efflux system membrane fusion protein